MIALLMAAEMIQLIYVRRVHATIMELASQATAGFAVFVQWALTALTAVSISTNVLLNRAWKVRLASMASVHFRVFALATKEANDVKFVSLVNSLSPLHYK